VVILAYRAVFLLIAVSTDVGAMLGLPVRKPPAAAGGAGPHHLMAH
jgi:hypothetical protein